MSKIEYTQEFMDSYLSEGIRYELDINLGLPLEKDEFYANMNSLNAEFVLPARIIFSAVYAPDRLGFVYSQKTWGLHVRQEEVVGKILYFFKNCAPSVDWLTSEGETEGTPLVSPQEETERPYFSWKYFEDLLIHAKTWIKDKTGLDLENKDHQLGLVAVIVVALVMIGLVFMRPYAVVASKVVSK